MKLSFSLNKSKPTAPVVLKKPSAFSLADDEDSTNTLTTQLNNEESSRSGRKRLEAELKVDETVYEYDEVYDKMQEAKLRQKEIKDMDTKERKVCLLS